MPLPLQIAAFVFGFISIIVTIIVGLHKLTRTIENAQSQINSRMERLEMRIAVVENQNRVFLQVFPKIIASLMSRNALTQDVGSISLRKCSGRFR